MVGVSPGLTPVVIAATWRMAQAKEKAAAQRRERKQAAKARQGPIFCSSL